jgi:CRISPR/Cas system-associated protein Cas10 (large subunit of type III CRISPR-Cas system)
MPTMIRKYLSSRGKRIVLICKHCGKEFETLQLKANAGREKFCSRECYNQYRKECCTSIKERNILYQKKSKYGLTEEEYKGLFDAQGNKCSICGTSFEVTKAFVDHDHKTGGVRGLLCSQCNTLLGMAKDNTEVLEAAIQYLRNS